METAQPSPAPVTPAPARNEKQEKHQHNEKGEKHEKGQFGFIGYLIAGLLLVFFGALAYTINAYHWIPTGAEGAFWLLVIGIVILVFGIYLWMRAKRRFPAA